MKLALSTTIVCLLTLVAAGATARADQLEVPAAASSTAPAAPSMPGRGQHMDTVLRTFGDPVERVPAVGGNLPQHPPITRWIYPGFTVYFEHQLVIASVVNRAAKPSAP